LLWGGGFRLRAQMPAEQLNLPVVKIRATSPIQRWGLPVSGCYGRPKLLGHWFPGNGFTGGEDQSYFGTRGLQVRSSAIPALRDRLRVTNCLRASAVAQEEQRVVL
jgi:hypothetical protein